MAKSFGNSYSYTGEGPSEPKLMQQQHEFGFCKKPKTCTMQNVGTPEKHLQGNHKSLHDALVANQLMNTQEDYWKGKAPKCDLPGTEMGEEKTTAPSNYTEQLPPQMFTCGSVLTPGTNTLQSANVHSEQPIRSVEGNIQEFGDINRKKVPISNDGASSRVQQHPADGPPHLVSESQSPHQHKNAENQRNIRNKTSATRYRNNKRQNTHGDAGSDTSMSHLKRRHVNTDSSISQTENENEGVSQLNEVKHRMEPFSGVTQSGLKPEIVQALIHILDDNNELVQVFRTARDRVEEGNVPEFKIQLYNVSGAQEYQLPSSGTLGGIVFQPDPNSHTDYGMIGDAIQVNMETSEKKQFTTYLIPGKTYQITGFTCVPTINWQQTLENKTSLLFTRFTKFDPIPPFGFPNHYFRFVSYNRLPCKVVDPDDKARKVYPVLTDYIGCYINSGEKEEWGNPNKDQMLLRRVEIQNLNRNSVELTLWDNLAETFPKEKIDALEKPVIIAVSSCRVTRFRNNLQLSSTPATYYYINPEIPELPQYKAEYKAAFDLNPPLQVVRHPYQDKEQEKMRNRIPFSKLLTENPFTHTGVRFTCEGTITGLDTSREWYYPSCTTCPNKIQVNEGVTECKIHGPLPSPSYRYNFKAHVTDTTDTITMTFFSPKADYIVGLDCQTLVNSLENADPREFLEKILAVIGKKHIFQFHYNTNSRQGPTNFILHEILDKPETQPQIKDKPSGSGTPHQQSETINQNVPENEEMKKN
ncbi:replication protein A 70 kDa DNA-binding subunit [Artemisia annua]|uniref:Replication protein A 70 kDa DNA-binding subunit n=1 Tax=Artemisia annua TaxID=35608 RepID=A0A2U1M5E0_ARTAN|nr:replication protein A 70 kDa DNA-binding subunit [Artemisia annua]